MRRLPLVVLALALPAAAQDIDAGVPLAVDAGTPPPPVDRVGHHFTFVRDADLIRPGSSDVQVWLTPRWGRVDPFAVLEVRAGFVQGICPGWAFGFFLDVTPGQVGDARPESTIDGRLTAFSHIRLTLPHDVHVGNELELNIGLHGFSGVVAFAADVQLGALRLALDVQGYTDANLDGPATLTTSRLRQSLGFSYTLTNGFSIGVEAQNRLHWAKDLYGGDAVLIGPSLAYRGERIWFLLSLLPQVAAVKVAAKRGGDPLELDDNERFTMRLMLGVNVR